jgi:hypothetical protein
MRRSIPGFLASDRGLSLVIRLVGLAWFVGVLWF